MDHILRFDFGYSWPWNYGHLVACGLFVALAVMTWRCGWPRSLLALAVALAEVARVLRPDGEFLLMVINPDGWARLAYPFSLHHGYFDAATNHDFWRSSAAAGFDTVEMVTQPAMLYLLARQSWPAACR